MVGPADAEVLDTLTAGRSLQEVYGYRPGWGVPSQADQDALVSLMRSHDEAEVAVEGPPETRG
jgi:hypothetical protein